MSTGKKRESNRRWREANPESVRESDRRYRAANPESVRESQRRRREANRETIRESSRRYREAHRKEIAEHDHERHESIRAAVFDHYGRSCQCCGAADQLTIDHVNGGGAEHREELFGKGRAAGSTAMYLWLIRNGFPPGFQPLCRPCNRSKGRGECCQLDHQEATR
jgi:hypothetical protein